MKKFTKLGGVLVLFILVTSPKLFSETSADVGEEQQISEQLIIAQNPAAETVSQVRQQKTSDGFERVPVRTVYGPLGIIFKVLEITFQRAYILFEF